VAPYRIAVIGLGKIAQDQHLPVIAANPGFELAAVVSQRGLGVPGVPTFRTPAELYAAVPDLVAVSVCTPPDARTAIAREALDAGKHVLLEKPPATTLSEVEALTAVAGRRQRLLFATWHSRFNPAVAEARRLLEGRTIRRLDVQWKEDVRHWHPGQDWVWQAGGFGVFDPGINALSIVTEIVPSPLSVAKADLTFPSNSDTPIAATLAFTCLEGPEEASLSASFDWRQEGEQTWTIEIETADGTLLALHEGGTRLVINGEPGVSAPSEEYQRIYAHWAELLAAGRSDVDVAPLRLVADAFLVGRRHDTAAFHW